MYAIIQTGSKQYRASPGDVLQVEKLAGEIGSAVDFKEVLFVSQPKEGSDSQITLGTPTVSGASVSGKIVGQGRGEKLIVFKFKAAKGYRKKHGHRQEYTQVLITDVSGGAAGKASLSPAEVEAKTKSFFSTLAKIEEQPKVRVNRANKRADKAAAAVNTDAPKAAKPSSAKKKTTAKKKA